MSAASRRCRALVHELVVLGATDPERRDRLLREIGSDAGWLREELRKDVYRVIHLVQDAVPAVRWEQLPVSHDVDDDGLWFFSLPGVTGDVQVESSSGQAPFIVEGHGQGQVAERASVDEAARLVVEWLGAGRQVAAEQSSRLE